MRKIFYLLSGAFLMVLLLQCNSDEKGLNKRLTRMAAELNESTPVMLDQYTRFDKASVVTGNMFQYQYTVLNTKNPDSLVDIGLQSLRERSEERRVGKECRYRGWADHHNISR